MEVVSATKMRKSQEFALRARPFAVASLEMLRNIVRRTSVFPPLLQSRPVVRALLLVVTSDKGLAGAFNANVLKKADSIFDKNGGSAFYRMITVGKKARDHFERKGVAVDKAFTGFGDYTEMAETIPIADRLIEGFSNASWDEAVAIYTNFRTTLQQEAVVKKILPATLESIENAVASILPEKGKFAYVADFKKEHQYAYEYQFEPTPAEILQSLVSQLIRMHVHHLILESNASEHSARMVAMKSASDNAKDLITSLTLTYNKVRQATITQELAEITGGREALEQ